MRSKTILLLFIVLASCSKKEEEYVTKRSDISESVFASGYIESPDFYHLTAQTDGIIKDITAQEGDSISMGQSIILVDNPVNLSNSTAAEETWQIAAENVSKNAPAYQEALTALAYAEEKLLQDQKQLRRMQDLSKQNAVSNLEVETAALTVAATEANCKTQRQRIAQIEQQARLTEIGQSANRLGQKENASNNIIRAAEPGRLIQLMKKKGDFVRKGDIIAKVTGKQSLVARLNIDETGIGKVRVGQSVNILLNTNRDRAIRGKVQTIYPQFDMGTQSFVVDVLFDSPIEFNVIGTRLEANILIEERNQVLVIPRKFLDYSNRVRIKGEEQLRTIEVGFKSTEWVEVLSGLQENEILLPHKR